VRPTTFLLVVYSVIVSFQVFDVVYVLTRGGPAQATTFVAQYAYEQGFIQRSQGFAAAVGVVLYVIVMVLTLAQWRLSRGRDAT
jgi:ABC-type sugar transport system permease subunit